MTLNWQKAPVKTEWGNQMVVAEVEIDEDHTLTIYCERDQIHKVNASLTKLLNIEETV